jgi:DNA-binding NarL/FixJ family response regulator
LLRSINGIEVVGILNDSRMVMDYLKTNTIDIVLSDLHMPHFSGIDLQLNIKCNFPAVKVVLLTMADDVVHIREAIKAGVSGYILKKSGREELEKALHLVMSGKKYYSEDVIEELGSKFGDDLNNALPETIEHLTQREIEVLILIAQEKKSSEIAEMLFISLPTVESHRSSLMRKLGVKSSIGMVKFAFKHGLVD